MSKRLLVLASLAAVIVASAPAVAQARELSPDELLARYQPALVFDATERFLPVSVDDFLDDADLQRQEPSGTWTTVSSPLARLPVRGGGWRLDHRGCTPVGGLTAVPCYAAAARGPSAVYGRVTVLTGTTVLQYWLFYDYDFWSLTYPPGALAWQAHEGDWEVVTIVLDVDKHPVGAAYSQHCAGEWRNWDRVTKQSGTHPIVYVATGSHANLFAPGTHPIPLGCYPASIRTILESNGITPLDFVVQPGAVVDPDPATLERIRHNAPRWLRFPGTWGEAQYVNIPPPLGPGIVPFGTSPVGPQQHDVWTAPLKSIAAYPVG